MLHVITQIEDSPDGARLHVTWYPDDAGPGTPPILHDQVTVAGVSLAALTARDVDVVIAAKEAETERRQAAEAQIRPSIRSMMGHARRIGATGRRQRGGEGGGGDAAR